VNPRLPALIIPLIINKCANVLAVGRTNACVVNEGKNSYARLENRTGCRILFDFWCAVFPLHVIPNSVSAEEPGVNCLYCYSSRLRFSRFHLFDVSRLLMLQLPVRCRSCGERFYASIFRAWKLGLVKKTAHKPPHNKKDEPPVRRDSQAI
jgi:hypothetical protein